MNKPQRVSLKQSNRKRILDILRKSPEVSVAEISLETAISKPTVQKVINHFAESGYIQSEGKGSSTDEGGRKPQLYRFNGLFGYVVSIHVGPDFLFSAIINMNAEILHSDYRDLDKVDINDVTRMCADVITDFSQNKIVAVSKMISIAIALPGIVNPSKGILVFTPHFPGWGNNYPFVANLQKLITIQVPVFCDNINRFQAFAEMKIGKAEGKNNFIIIDAMEEGLGSGIVIDGQLKHGAHDFAGEIGHMLLMPISGPKCICGGKGCFEALVSLRRINELIREGRDRHQDSLIFINEATEPMLSRLLHAYQSEDEFAAVIMDEISFWFASGINSIIMVSDPELIILEGIYTAFGAGFIRLIKYHLERLVYPGIVRSVDIVFSEFGRERGVLGAGIFSIWSFFEQQDLYSD